MQNSLYMDIFIGISIGISICTWIRKVNGKGLIKGLKISIGKSICTWKSEAIGLGKGISKCICKGIGKGRRNKYWYKY